MIVKFLAPSRVASVPRSPPGKNFNVGGGPSAANGPEVCTLYTCPCIPVRTLAIVQFRCDFPKLALHFAKRRALA